MPGPSQASAQIAELIVRLHVPADDDQRNRLLADAQLDAVKALIVTAGEEASR
jgi:hypothetical protein